MVIAHSVITSYHLCTSNCRHCQNHDMLYTELLFSGKLNVLSQTPGGTGNDLGSLATFMGNQASEAEG